MFLISALFVNLTAAFASADPFDIRSFSNQICSAPTKTLDAHVAQAWPAIKQACNECKQSTLDSLLSQYHPGNLELSEAVRTQQSASGLRLKMDLGTAETWQVAALQTDELRDRAFGKLSCQTSVARFQKDSARLSFVATEHVRVNPSARDPVFKVIRDEFQSLDPQVVVVEGYPRRFPCAEAIRLYLTPVDQIQSESELLVKLAIEANRRIKGGEPESLELAENDSLYFEVLREMTTHRPGVTEEQAFNEAMKRHPGAKRGSFKGFLDWYQEKNKRAFRLEDAFSAITPSYNLRRINESPRGTNALVDQSDRVRNNHVLKVVRESLLEEGRVLVVYGRDHLPSQLPAFEAAFGRKERPAAQCPPLPPWNEADPFRCP